MTSPTSSSTAGNPETLLAVATSSPQGSLALAERGPQGWIQLGQTAWDKKAMHSELATVKLEELLRQTQRKLKDLTHVAVINGPGSFTGIRVGLNLARSLAYGLSLPAAALNALAVLAFKNLADGERGLVAMKAVQNFYYTAVYERAGGLLREILSPRSLAKDELAQNLNSATRIWIEGETEGFSVRTEAQDVIAWLAAQDASTKAAPGLRPASFFSWKELKPLYIRASEAEEKLRQGYLKPLI